VARQRLPRNLQAVCKTVNAERDEKRLLFSNRSLWKRRPPLWHPPEWSCAPSNFAKRAKQVKFEPFVGEKTAGNPVRVATGAFFSGTDGNATGREQYPMKLLMVGLVAFTGVAFAADLAPVSYHDGTLVAFHSQASPSNCSGSLERACSDDSQAQYTVQSEGIVYVLTPALSSTMSWSKAFSRYSSLYQQRPGTPLQLRDDGKHIFARVGSRESMFTAIDAR
jgi:hypothetical protein